MPRGRKGYDHRDPVTEEMLELEERRKQPVEKNTPETPWWTTNEVSKVLHKTEGTVRMHAVEMGLKTFVKGKPCRWSFTDVIMLRKHMEAKKNRRDHRQKMIELQRMLDANDRGEL